MIVVLGDNNLLRSTMHL